MILNCCILILQATNKSQTSDPDSREHLTIYPFVRYNSSRPSGARFRHDMSKH